MIVPINIRFDELKVDFCMDLDRDIITDASVLHYAEKGLPCEPETCYVLLRFLKEGMIAVDAGANVGFFTLLMSKLVGPTGRVLAFEPGHNNLLRLKANLALNDCKNVKVIEKPLWSSHTSVDLFHYKDGGANSLWAFAGGDKAVQMPSTTLDIECTQVDLVKLDIEGAEVRALRGAYKLLRQRPIIVTELNEVALERASTSIEELRKLLRDYSCWGLSETGHCPVWLSPQIEVVPCKPNTNVMFATLGQVEQMWPRVFV